MSILLGLVTVLAAFLTLAVGATVFQLRSSDPAGNGLAHVFLTISAIALWVMLAIALGLATLRQPRHPLPWASINLYTLLLFVLAAAGQAACLAQLTGRSVDGWYRVVLQMSMIVPPVATITHVIWRAFGAPVPTRAATLGVGVAVVVFSVLALVGLLRPKPTPREATVDALEVPAPLIRGTSEAVVIRRGDSTGSRDRRVAR